MEIRIESLNAIHNAASEFLKLTEKYKIFAFEAEMGTGKTTFITSLLNAMGIEEIEGSPTYSLVNVYESKMFGRIYHFDLFRIETEEEAFDIGIEEMLYSDSYCFIEWPNKIENFLPEKTVFVRMRTDGNVRVLEFEI